MKDNLFNARDSRHRYDEITFTNKTVKPTGRFFYLPHLMENSSSISFHERDRIALLRSNIIANINTPNNDEYSLVNTSIVKPNGCGYFIVHRDNILLLLGHKLITSTDAIIGCYMQKLSIEQNTSIKKVN